MTAEVCSGRFSAGEVWSGTALLQRAHAGRLDQEVSESLCLLSAAKGRASLGPAPEAEVRVMLGPVLCELDPGASRSDCRSHRALSLIRVPLSGPTMLSLDFLDDVRRMNKRQVRLAPHCFPRLPFSLGRCHCGGPADLWARV